MKGSVCLLRTGDYGRKNGEILMHKNSGIQFRFQIMVIMHKRGTGIALQIYTDDEYDTI